MRFLKRLFRLIIVILLLCAALIVYLGKEKYENVIEELPLTDAVKEIKSKENYTAIENISPLFIDAIVSVEDKRFYIHNGIDVLGIGRAIYNNIKLKSLSEGGSSITQQLAKNIYFINDRDNTITRKVAELFIAKDLEEEYSKNEILELYFNNIYYGSGYYCIYDASKGYFGKTPIELNDYEATLLAGIPNAPSIYSPKVNPDLSHKRQEKVIEAMVENDKLTKEEAKEILN